MSGCGITHHAGCACHEARRDAELATPRAEVATLRDSLAAAQVQLGEAYEGEAFYRDCHRADCSALQVAHGKAGEVRRDLRAARFLAAGWRALARINRIAADAQAAERRRAAEVVEAARAMLGEHSRGRLANDLRLALRDYDAAGRGGGE